MYNIERIHVSAISATDLSIITSGYGSRAVAIYDESHAACKDYIGCGPTDCATPSCIKISTRMEGILSREGFKL